MTHSEIFARVDHTLLNPAATWKEIMEACLDAKKLQTASVCIPPCFVSKVKRIVRDETTVCTVVGFPNGNQTTDAKLFETEDALRNGADEIDMVINIGALKEKNDEYVLEEIRKIKELCGRRILKVIIETCLLTKREKIRMCSLVTESGADYIKTSTGFSKRGATFEDVALLAEHVGPGVKVKAAGGISSFEDAEKFIQLGASRLGTSRLVKIEKEERKARYHSPADSQ